MVKNDSIGEYVCKVETTLTPTIGNHVTVVRQASIEVNVICEYLISVGTSIFIPMQKTFFYRDEKFTTQLKKQCVYLPMFILFLSR